MTQQSFNAWWDSLWSARIAAANRNKDPNDAWIAMVHEFAGLPPAVRPFGDALMADWLRSDDAERRFVALAVVADVSVAGVAPALQELAARLRRSPGHEAPFELAKVESCLARCAAAAKPEEIDGVDGRAGHVTIDGRTIHAHGWSRTLDYAIAEAFDLDGCVIVRFAPESRGGKFGQFRNLIALGPGGERMWTADLPTTSSGDHYYRITSRRPLIAGAPSYECQIDPATGHIVRREFLK